MQIDDGDGRRGTADGSSHASRRLASPVFRPPTFLAIERANIVYSAGNLYALKGEVFILTNSRAARPYKLAVVGLCALLLLASYFALVPTTAMNAAPLGQGVEAGATLSLPAGGWGEFYARGISLRPGEGISARVLTYKPQATLPQQRQTALFYGLKWGYADTNPYEVAVAVWWLQDGEWRSEDRVIAERIANAAVGSGVPSWNPAGRSIAALAVQNLVQIEGITLTPDDRYPAVGNGKVRVRNLSAQELLLHLPYGMVFGNEALDVAVWSTGKVETSADVAAVPTTEPVATLTTTLAETASATPGTQGGATPTETPRPAAKAIKSSPTATTEETPAGQEVPTTAPVGDKSQPKIEATQEPAIQVEVGAGAGKSLSEATTVTEVQVSGPQAPVVPLGPEAPQVTAKPPAKAAPTKKATPPADEPQRALPEKQQPAQAEKPGVVAIAAAPVPVEKLAGSNSVEPLAPVRNKESSAAAPAKAERPNQGVPQPVATGDPTELPPGVPSPEPTGEQPIPTSARATATTSTARTATSVRISTSIPTSTLQSFAEQTPTRTEPRATSRSTTPTAPTPFAPIEFPTAESEPSVLPLLPTVAPEPPIIFIEPAEEPTARIAAPNYSGADPEAGSGGGAVEPGGTRPNRNPNAGGGGSHLPVWVSLCSLLMVISGWALRRSARVGTPE